MFLKKHLINIALAASLTSFFAAGAHADVPGDIAAGLPAGQVLENAIAQGMGVADAIAAIAGVDRGMALAAVAAAIQASPEQAAQIAAAVASAAPGLALDVATTAAAIAPESADAILVAVQAAVPELNSDAIQIAVTSGVEQSQQPGFGADYIPGEAPAAGESSIAPPPAPPVTTPTVTTPPSVSPS